MQISIGDHKCIQFGIERIKRCPLSQCLSAKDIPWVHIRCEYFIGIRLESIIIYSWRHHCWSGVYVVVLVVKRSDLRLWVITSE